MKTTLAPPLTTCDPAGVIEPLPPETLEVTAYAADDPNEIHAMRHREYPIWGVQFHPESILTDFGRELLSNFLVMARTHRESVQRV